MLSLLLLVKLMFAQLKTTLGLILPRLLLVMLILHNLVNHVQAHKKEKMQLCLHNCALCVQQFENGIYNGQKCARKCLRLKSKPKVVDPDCNVLRFFNSKLFRKS